MLNWARIDWQMQMRETSRGVDKKLHDNNNLKFGKSNWAINEVHSLAVEKNIPVLYLDTEMQTGTFLTRLIAIDSQLPIREIETLSYLQDPKKKEIVEKSIERIKKAPIIHKYSNSWTRQKVRDDVISLYRKNKIQVLI